MTLGQRIAQYRKAMGISQEELGGRLGVSRQAVSKWETDAAAPDNSRDSRRESLGTDYAVDSYKVQAAYYLMKPLNYGELSAALDRIFGRNESGERELQVELKTGIKAAVPLKKILYLECIRRMPLVHTVDSVIEAVSSFSSLADQLKQDKRFLCCNRSIYVNMDWIREAGDMDLVLKNGEHLPMRVRGRAQIKKDYLRYMLRELRENDKTV